MQNLYIKTFFRSLVFAFLFATSACSTTNTPEFSTQTSSDVFVNAFPEVSLSELSEERPAERFKPGDIAEIEVYNVENLSTTYVVDSRGNVSFPLLGQLKVAGLSPLELQQTLTHRYGSSYLQSPNIIVRMDGGELGSIVVDGSVNKPGVFKIDKIVRLSEAIALAEGINDEANREEIFIVRVIDNKRQILTVNYDDVRKRAANDPNIIPNDAIFVQDSRGRVVFREFLRTVPLLNTLIILAR